MSHSLIRYPGGKNYAVKVLAPFIPSHWKELVSPFCGGMSFELYLNKTRGIRIHASDAWDELAIFWQEALKDPQAVAREARKYYGITVAQYNEIRNNPNRMMGKTRLEMAALFFVANRCAYGGRTWATGTAKKGTPYPLGFTTNSLRKLHDFDVQGVTVECMDWKDALEKRKDKPAYLDPPYYKHRKEHHSAKLYKVDSVDHEELAEYLRGRSNWILSYDNNKYIRELYEGFDFHYPQWMYGFSRHTRSGDQDQELLIVNIEEQEQEAWV